MARKVSSIYSALLLRKKLEDQCTDFFLWLLGKLPSEFLLELAKSSGLAITRIDESIKIESQFHVGSIPDGRVELEEGKNLLIEVKVYPNYFDEEQCNNHYSGGKEKFGNDSIYLLFISNDVECPPALSVMMSKNEGRIGFCSWKSIILSLADSRYATSERFEIIISEFIKFAKHNKLGVPMSLTNYDIKEYVDNYPKLFKQELISERLNSILDKIADAAVIKSNEIVKLNKDDIVAEFPCLYRALNIKRWHVKDSSAFIFMDILNKKIGVVLTGYQDGEQEKNRFRQFWETKKMKFSGNEQLLAFVWDDHEEVDDVSFFRPIPITRSAVFNPLDTSVFEDSYYFGVCFDLNIDQIEGMDSVISENFKSLISEFVE